MEELVTRQETELEEANKKLQKLKRQQQNADKKRRKAIGQEITLQETQIRYMKSRHQDERDELSNEGGQQNDHGGDSNSETKEKENKDEDKATVDIAKEPKDTVENDAPEQVAEPKKSKAQKRREKKEQEARERERRIEEGDPEDGQSMKELEYAEFTKILTPLGLKTKPIKPDGHCMFRAILEQVDPAKAKEISDIRKETADYMREHQSDFAPYLTTDDGNCLDSDGYAAYCTSIEKTAKWGGQCELLALSNILERPIEVYRAAGKPTTIGESFPAEVIRLSYHLHEFSLGEHYNAVIPR
eukprot:m.170299 g.170299  ORF g.170299 m.170299 type:complete len:301 (-) comp15336_c0_seq8:5425-6327(-)